MECGGGGRRAARLRGEWGEVTSTVLVLPVLLFVLFLVVQFALAWHAKAVLTAAAQDGLRAEQTADGPADGAAVARALVAEHASALLADVRLDVARDEVRVRVEARGRVVSVVPGLDLTVGADAEGPRERFVPAGQR